MTSFTPTRNELIQHLRYKAIMFDVIGTTVVERDPTVITTSFELAFREFGLHLKEATVRANRGRDKKEMIAILLNAQGGNPQLASKIYDSFVKNVESRLDAFEPRTGAVDLFDLLQRSNVRIALGTGLSRDLFTRILKHIGWRQDRFDYVGVPENGIRARPHADMLQDMMRTLHVKPTDVLKVGDTVADIQEGKNAGVDTVAILAGTQSSEQLMSENPTFVINKLSELKQIVANENE